MSTNLNVEIISPVRDYQFIESWREIVDDSHFWFKWRFNAAYQLITDLKIPLNENWTVLDVGCGNGLVREQFEAVSNWTVDGTDIDLEVLNKANTSKGKTMYYDVTTCEPRMKEHYDAIILFDVLEHIYDTQSFIESLLFHLKPGGKLIANVPALQSVYSRFDKVVGHERRYKRNSFAAEFRNFPIRIDEMRYWGLVNIPFLFARKGWVILNSSRMTDDEICSTGLQPPNEAVNKFFTYLMKAEMKVSKRPFCGSSLLLAATKL